MRPKVHISVSFRAILCCAVSAACVSGVFFVHFAVVIVIPWLFRSKILVVGVFAVAEQQAQRKAHACVCVCRQNESLKRTTWASASHTEVRIRIIYNVYTAYKTLLFHVPFHSNPRPNCILCQFSTIRFASAYHDECNTKISREHETDALAGNSLCTYNVVYQHSIDAF